MKNIIGNTKLAHFCTCAC